MTVQAAPATFRTKAAVVFVEPFHALVARLGDPAPIVVDIERSRETQAEFLCRIAHETTDCDRLIVMGPGADRLAFEREYVAIYKRPDRLVDDEAAATATRFDLLDRLRVLGS